MKDRIKQIMLSLNMTQVEFAKFLGVSAPVLSNIFKGRNKPTLATVSAIREKLPNISYVWLIDGVGEMYEEGNTQDSQAEKVEQPEFLGAAITEEVSSPSGKTNATKVKKANLALSLDDEELKNADKVGSRITEIRVFFDDSHYESFVPIKS